MSKKKHYSHSRGRKRKPRSVRLVKETNQPEMHIGYYQLVFASYFRQLGDRADELRDMMAEGAVRTILSILNPPREFTSLESVDILRSIERALEDRIAAIVSKHHVYYWVHLYRRLAPENTFRHLSLVTVALYRECMETAFVKYGRFLMGNDLITGRHIDPQEIMSGEAKRVCEEYGFPFQPAAGNYIKDFNMTNFMELLSLERLVSEFYGVAQRLRRAYKGGRLFVQDTETYDVINDPITESLIKSFDKRNEDFGGHATERGIPTDRPDDKYREWDAICWVPRYNVERLTLEECPQHYLWNISDSQLSESKSDMAPNFLYMLADMGIYYTRHRFLRDIFVKEYGFSLECFVKCIMALFRISIYSSMGTNGLAGIEFLQRAYMHSRSFEQILDAMNLAITNEKTFQSIPELMDYKPSLDEIRAFLRAFTLDTARRNDIDLVTRSPRPLVIETWEGNYLIDYSALTSILHSFIHFESANWTEKGTIFEDHIIEKLGTSGFMLWERQKVLRAYDETANEIDISFLLGKVLFLCECRAIGGSRAFERGETVALDFRRRKWEAALQDCDECAEWLSTRRRGLNFKIPENIDVIIPVVVSPFVEYIWSVDENLWLTTEIPRVCTLGELATITSTDILSEIIGRPFVQYIVSE